MGVSTDGLLCYGINVPEDHELPWSDSDKYDNGIDDWWLEQCEWKPSMEVWDKDGEYLPGVTREDVDRYYDERREFRKSNPLPIDDLWHCSYEYPMHIIAVPSTVKRAWRGSPEPVGVLEVSDEEVSALVEFCRKYEISGEIGWWLASMWG